MKRTLILGGAICALLASATLVFADLARPNVSPNPEEGKLVYHTGLTVAADPKAWEARLQISQETLTRIQDEMRGSTSNTTMIQRVMHSSTRTIMAGLFMFLSVSFAGVWLVRSSTSRRDKAIAAVFACAMMLGIGTIIVRANAGPPGYIRWQNLPANLTKGELTRGGLDIEIVPGDGGMKLIVPLRKERRPGEE
jgi:hypothetical protein